MIRREFIKTSEVAMLSGLIRVKLDCSKSAIDEFNFYNGLGFAELVKNRKVTEVEIKI